MSFWESSNKTALPLTEETFGKFIKKHQNSLKEFNLRTLIVKCTCPKCNRFFMGEIIDSPRSVIKCPKCAYEETLEFAIANFLDK